MKTKRVKLENLVPDNLNANRGTARGAGMVEHSIRNYGAGRSILVDAQNRIIAGNKTHAASLEAGLQDAVVVETDGTQLVVVRRSDVSLDSPEGRALAIADNRAAEVGLDWDLDALAEISEELDLSQFWFEGEIDIPDLSLDGPGAEDGLTDPDEVPEVEGEPTTKRGDVWILGDHRVMCGDSTNADDVARLMGGQKAALMHADPPYGMGKEKDGVANDNLYRDKLDSFQMQWWAAFRPHLDDNASAYIWGNAPDLWRLWHSGGLSESERLTFRNEIVWDKGHGLGIASGAHRQYATVTERALFFMLGEQGFNNNADNYWEGWEPVRSYLKAELSRVGDIKWAKRAAGHSLKSGCHWFDSSQWSMPTEKVYKSWQTEANGKAFKREYEGLKREYEDLKREFYSTRAFFDNTHENMTDVWSFPRVQGEDRHGHATPKPVEMIDRALRSSCEAGSIVVEPFGGSGSTLISAERTGRRCVMMELVPDWVDVIVKRWEEFTGKKAELESADK